jgi:hypothetical protein
MVAADLPGGTLKTVQCAIASGRLSNSLTRDRNQIDRGCRACRCRVGGRHLRRPCAAHRAHTVESTLPPDVPPLAVSRARREAAQAELAELELAEGKGQVVDVDQVRADVIAKFSVVKTRLLGGGVAAGAPRPFRRRSAHGVEAPKGLASLRDPLVSRWSQGGSNP